MNALYQIYKELFLKERYSYNFFKEQLEKAKIIKYEKDNKVLGFAAIKQNHLLLICVKKEFQNLTIGTYLLRQAEKEIEKEYHTMILGDKNSFFYGTPLDCQQFFLKKGFDDIYINEDYLSHANKESVCKWKKASVEEKQSLLEILKIKNSKLLETYSKESNIYIYLDKNIKACYIEKQNQYEELENVKVWIDNFLFLENTNIDYITSLKSFYKEPFLIRNFSYQNISLKKYFNIYQSYNIMVKQLKDGENNVTVGETN